MCCVYQRGVDKDNVLCVSFICKMIYYIIILFFSGSSTRSWELQCEVIYTHPSRHNKLDTERQKEANPMKTTANRVQT